MFSGDGALRYNLQVLRFYMRCRSDSLPGEPYTIHLAHDTRAGRKIHARVFPLTIHVHVLILILLCPLLLEPLTHLLHRHRGWQTGRDESELLTGEFSLAHGIALRARARVELLAVQRSEGDLSVIFLFPPPVQAVYSNIITPTRARRVERRSAAAEGRGREVHRRVGRQRVV